MSMSVRWKRRMRSLRRRSRAGLALLGVAGGLAGTLLGCSNIEPVAPVAGPITQPEQLYMDLTLNYRAINLSTAAGSNTLQLTATPRDALGNPMTGLPAPVFKSPDTTKVRVTPEGLLTAVGTITNFQVTATLTVGPVTHADTTWINVTALPQVWDTLSIHPVPPANTEWPLRPPSGSGFSWGA